MIRALGASFVLIFDLCPFFSSNEVTLGGLLDSFRKGTGHQKNQDMIRSLELSAPPWSSGKRREAGDWVNDRWYPREEASIKIPKVWGLESFQVGEYIHVPGGWHPNSTGPKAPAFRTLSGSPCVSLNLVVPLYSLFHLLLYNKPVNVRRYFPEFCELFYEMIKPEEGKLDLWLVFEVGWGQLTVVSVRIELNCRTSSWCHKELFDVGGKIHIFGVRSIVSVVAVWE